MVDMSEFVAPKSNQLNADDLLPGPRTIRITRVSGTGNGEQPVAVSFEGDDGKPFLPCKSMRRVMIAAWGADASQYAGRSMTLYRDPKVKWGGMEVGGIRISHMSHIEREMVMALTMTKKERAPYRVKPLVVEAAKPAEAGLTMIGPDGQERSAPNAATWRRWCLAAIGRMESAQAVQGWLRAMADHMAAAPGEDAQAVQEAADARSDELDAAAGA